eukprot:CAMPEP_0197022432 /NCGR_PEP_ID=MMETSP1384-20130603/3314_1 /TAXON_ID=29189 /ORGANISM="Ammonia sp." /LENGTH=570 /DNA_ID=CAMNT_0042450477 /DNA_START=78 /DNA_END=1790 /DNA_ORIENTATION=+
MALIRLFASIVSCVLMTTALDPPYFVGYVDFPTCAGVGTATADADCLANLGVPGYASHPFNVINFAFYVSTQDLLYDAAKVWANPSTYFSSSFRSQITGLASPTDAQFRASIKALYASAGVKLILSVFGGTDHPMTSGQFPESTLLSSGGLRDKIAAFVTDYDFDGVDIDFEETSYFQGTGSAVSWLCTLTNGLRASLGSSKIITHAPQAPYMGASSGNSNIYTGGGYLAVHQSCGSNIDWYNVQFYNQGSTAYDTYDELFVSASGWSQTTAVLQIINGQNPSNISIPAEKLVVGKFIRPGTDGSAGWVSAANLKTWLQTAMQSTQIAGFMIWQYYGDKLQDFAWSNTVATAWDGTSITTTTTTTTSSGSTPAPTTTTTRSGAGSVSVGLSINSGCTCGSSCSSGSCWYFGLTVSPPSGVSITTVKVRNRGSSTWIDAEWGSTTAWGFGSGVSYITPVTVQVQTSSGTVYGVLPSLATSSSATANSASAYTDDLEAEESEEVHWTVWLAVILAILVVVACVIAGVAFYRRRNKGKATFEEAADAEPVDPEQIEVETQMVNEQDPELETTR